MLQASNIKKAYGKQEVLRGVNVTVEPGRITVLIGPSGSGKTTLLRSVALLDQPDSGSVTVDDDTYTFPMKRRNALSPPWPKVTVVFQQLFLWPHLTLRQNIMLPVHKRRIETNGQLDELIERFDMAAFIDRYPNQVSLGQRQRAALARALVLQPSYVLLDEITSSLDVEQVGAILSYLRVLRERGIGILLITHLIHFASRAADHVVFMDKGEVVQSGGPEIIEAPTHERIKRFLSVVEAAS